MTLHFSQIGFTDERTFIVTPSFHKKRPLNILTHLSSVINT